MAATKKIEAAILRESISHCLFGSVPSQILCRIPSSQIVNDTNDDYEIVDEYQIDAASAGSLGIKISVTDTGAVGINIHEILAIRNGGKCLMGNEPMPLGIDVLEELIAIVKSGKIIVRQNKITKDYKAITTSSLKSDIRELSWLKIYSRPCPILYDYIPLKPWPHLPDQI